MSTAEEKCTYVEFYSGIGGWTMALNEALNRYLLDSTQCRRISLRRLAALDHSDLCLDVLQHNFPDKADRSSGMKRKRPQTMSIERVTLSQAEEWKADIWAMSPPCQPHTRQHTNQDGEMEDPRSASFLHICDLLDCMDERLLPRILLLENVVGFESSQSCIRWRDVLSKRSYTVAHFHLTPTQVQIPNDRPRYYCIAVRSDYVVVDSDRSSLRRFVTEEAEIGGVVSDLRTEISELGVVPVQSLESGTQVQTEGFPSICEFIDQEAKDVESLRVPSKLLGSSASWCFDIVTPDDKRTACFTSSYGKFIRGTGSVLYEPAQKAAHDGGHSTRFQLVPPEEREFNPKWSEGLDLKHRLRYFSGREVARLMGFPEAETAIGTPAASFSFPEKCTKKQQWKLLGNSLNVRVAARVAELAIRLVDWDKLR